MWIVQRPEMQRSPNQSGVVVRSRLQIPVNREGFGAIITATVYLILIIFGELPSPSMGLTNASCFARSEKDQRTPPPLDVCPPEEFCCCFRFGVYCVLCVLSNDACIRLSR